MRVSEACPDPDDVVAYVEHDMSPAGRLAITEHLDGCAGCREVVALTASSLVDSTRQLGRYRLVRLLDAGGMGVVYEADDPQLNRRVAVKMLHSGQTRTGELHHEAQAMATLGHPAVARVYYVGRAGGRDFIVMELLVAGTLRDWLASRTPDRAEVMAAFAPLADGLAAVHQLGIIHRDIKPANILVRQDATLVLTDFGLCTSVPADATPPADEAHLGSQTSSGLVGTPAYMAPEQRAGARATQRSDQYSFALCLVEALAGRRADVDELGLPRPAARVLRRALSPKPADRFPSVRGMWRAFARSLNGRRRASIVAVPAVAAAALAAVASGLPTAQRECEDDAASVRRDLEAMASAAKDVEVDPEFAQTVDNMIDDLWTRDREVRSSETPDSTSARRCVRRQRHRLQLIASGLIEGRPGADSRWRESLDLADPRRCDEFDPPDAKADPKLEARIDSAEIYATRGEIGEAIRVLDGVVAAARGVPPDAALPRALRWRARALFYRNEFEPALRDAQWGYREASGLGRDDEVARNALLAANISIAARRADARSWLAAADAAARRLNPPNLYLAAEQADVAARFANASGNLDEARTHAKRALELMSRSPKDRPIMRADLLGLIAFASFNLAEFSQGAEAADAALAAFEQAHRMHGAGYIATLRTRAMIAGAQGDRDDELELLTRVGELVAASPDTPFSVRVNAIDSLADAYRGRGRYQDAITLLEDALAAMEGQDLHPHQAVVVLSSLGWTHIAAGEPERALPHIERALVLGGHGATPTTESDALVAVAQGVALGQLGRLEAAQVSFDAAIEVLEAAAGPNTPKPVWARQLRAKALAAEDPSGSRREIENAIQVFSQAMGPQSPYLVAAHEDLAHVCVMLRDVATARQSLRRAIEIHALSADDDHPVMVRLRRRLADLEQPKVSL